MFYFDLEKINDFVFGDDDERTSSVEITELQAINEDTGEMETVNKTIHEVKESTDMTNKQTIRYDLLKNMIFLLNNNEEINSTINQGLQTALLLTMKNYGFIVEINDDGERTSSN